MRSSGQPSLIATSNTTSPNPNRLLQKGIVIKDYAETLLGGRHCSMIVRRGVCLKLTDLSGGSNVGMLMYNLENPTERLNIPDSLKCQHTFKITQGNCLYSDMGRIFCSVVADDAGWHDATSGTCNEALLQNKPWSKDSYQQALNDFVRNGYDSFAIELGKYRRWNSCRTFKRPRF